MNALGLAFSLQGGRAQLPLAAVIDIGPSSSGLVSLVREALPADRRHEAGWFPLRMTPEHAINPCDTQLGCRSPLPAERTFLTNLLGLMVTPAGAAGVPDGMRELLGPALTGAYAMRSDKVAGAEPHAYTQGRDADVDAAIAQCGLRLPGEPLWWEVVDLLFEAGATDAAARAQRYAVPTLTDLLASAREPAVQGLVGDARYGSGGETVTQAFIRILTALSGDWPVMFSPTAFDVGGARLAAIDLAEVAPQGSAEADRQSAAFYLLARHALTRHWWIGEDALGAIPEPYRDWHAARLRDIRESPKRLCYDEFHRTAGAPAVRAQVERDVREARKLRVRLALASQRLEDFGGALAELANRYWILGAGGKAKEAETLAAMFTLGGTLSDVVRYRLTGPGPDGAPALLIAAGQGGRFEQLVVNTPGPAELWALTTSPADVALRRRVHALLPPARARAALARAFPEGTARPRIEDELRRIDRAGAGRAASEDAVLDRLADEVARAASNETPDSPRPAPTGRPDSTKPKGGTDVAHEQGHAAGPCGPRPGGAQAVGGREDRLVHPRHHAALEGRGRSCGREDRLAPHRRLRRGGQAGRGLGAQGLPGAGRGPARHPRVRRQQGHQAEGDGGHRRRSAGPGERALAKADGRGRR